MTLAPSPYLLTSGGQLNSVILKNLLFTNHSVASIVWGHDTSYFVPDESQDGRHQFFYTFTENDAEYKIPIVPFSKRNEAVIIYEILNVFQPEVLLTIGDINDFPFMKAIKMFYDKKLTWISIATNASYPLSENNIELLSDIDACLCTSNECFEAIQQANQNIDIKQHYVGTRFSPQRTERDDNKFRLLACGKNAQIDNLPTIMEVVCNLKNIIPEIELLIHSNVYDGGEFDLNLLKQRFDPKGEIIKFPKKYVSLQDGYSHEEMSELFSSTDIYISTSMVSATSMCLFDAISHGCVPIVTNVGCQKEIINKLENSLNLAQESLRCKCVKIMTTGETYLHICDPESLKEKIINIYEETKDNTNVYKNAIIEFAKNYTQKGFLDKLSEVLKYTEKSSTSLCLELAT